MTPPKKHNNFLVIDHPKMELYQFPDQEFKKNLRKAQ